MSRDQLEEHRKIWEGKPVLADVYAVWFEALLERAPPGATVLEIGAGPGFLARHARSHRPDLHWIASDLIETGWNDIVADGLRLPVRSGSLDALMGIDVIHHLARPALFFAEAARVLRPAGRLCAVEPWVTPFSYPIYRWAHQEGCTLRLDPWDPFRSSGSGDKEPFRGDNACVWRLIRDTRDSRWLEFGLSRPSATMFNGFAYLLSLGFRPASLLPRRLAPALIRFDEHASRLAGTFGLRILLCWERRP